MVNGVRIGAALALLLAVLAPVALSAAAVAERRADPPAAADPMAAGLKAFRAGQLALARAHFRAAAAQDNPAAETLLGTMAANGQGGPRDEAVSAAWFLKAARRGYAPAQLALADSFARGRGVPQDLEQARLLARAAALQAQPGAAQLALRLGPERYAMAGPPIR